MKSMVHGSGIFRCQCPRCGLDYLSTDIRQEWKGNYVCKDCWEPRNILDFYQTRNDSIPLPFRLPSDRAT